MLLWLIVFALVLKASGAWFESVPELFFSQ